MSFEAAQDLPLANECHLVDHLVEENQICVHVFFCCQEGGTLHLSIRGVEKGGEYKKIWIPT
jgi:hypothetical protein